MIERGYSHHEIGNALGRDQSVISREIKKNSVWGRYEPKKAQHKAYARRHNARFQFSHINEVSELEKHIIRELRRGYSPEAISGRIVALKKPWYASKTAIYDWLYSIYGQRYCKYLLSRRPYQKKRRSLKTKRPGIPGRVSIHERPVLTERDYEGDTIVSRQSTVTVVTLYNPVTMYGDARRVPNLKPAVVARAFKEMLAMVKAGSLTLDNGFENRYHQRLGIQTYFCDPYASWQKPGIENANRLFRRYLRKGTDLAHYSHQRISCLVQKLNHTPRKKLTWLTPLEVMAKRKLFCKKKKPRERVMQ